MKELYVKWAKKTAIKALKTAAQTAVSMITIGQAVTDINWQSVVSISLVAGLYSVLTSLASLPKSEKELEQFTRDDDDRSDDAPVELDPVSEDDKGDDK